MLRHYARRLRLNTSKAEQVLWLYIRNKNIKGKKFRRQHPIPPYIVDFVCLSEKLILEIDGGQHAPQKPYDQKRTWFLESKGFRVLRFWNNEVLGNMEGVLTVIERHL